jgi:hypothetical protein
MSSDHHPANTNERVPAFNPWAAWPGVKSYVAGWSALTCAGIGSWLVLQEAWLEAGGDLMRGQHRALNAGPEAVEAADALSAAMDDVRDCGAAVMQAQVDALDALRKSA